MRNIFFLSLILSGLIFGGCSSTNPSLIEKKEYPVSAEAESKYQSAEQKVTEGDYKSAEELLNQAYYLTKNDSQREKILFLLAEDMFLSGYYNDAHKWHQKLLNNYPKTVSLNKIIKRELEIGFKFIEGAKRSFCGLYIFSSHDFGMEIVRNTLKIYPYAEPAEEYHFKLAAHLFKSENYDDALQEYEDFIKIYPKSKLLAEAEYQISLCYLGVYMGSGYEITPLLEARKTISKFDKRYPDSSLNNEVKKLQSDINSLMAQRDYDEALFYIKNGKLKSARIYLESIIKNYPDTKWAKESNELLTTSVK